MFLHLFYPSLYSDLDPPTLVLLVHCWPWPIPWSCSSLLFLHPFFLLADDPGLLLLLLHLFWLSVAYPSLYFNPALAWCSWSCSACPLLILTCALFLLLFAVPVPVLPAADHCLYPDFILVFNFVLAWLCLQPGSHTCGPHVRPGDQEVYIQTRSHLPLDPLFGTCVHPCPPCHN